MIEQETIVNSLEDKVKKVISLLVQVKDENQKLSGENSKLKHALLVKDNEIKELQEKYEQLKFAKLLSTGSDDIHSAKLKVNKIVREIDKCIALLNK
jgi:hypothetical protein